jgi:hypothetical protein
LVAAVRNDQFEDEPDRFLAAPRISPFTNSVSRALESAATGSAAVTDAVRRAYEPFAQGDSVRLPASIWVVNAARF